MRILITNDDGFDAPGIIALREMLIELSHEITLAAPHTDNSAISHSISLGRPITIEDHGDKIYSLTGTPADCVMVALNSDFIEKPDLIISGINKGGNMGEDVHYSGTVAAAIEASFNGISAMSLSSACRTHGNYKRIFPFLQHLIDSATDPDGRILNVNYDPGKELTGIQETILGSRKYLDHFEFSGWKGNTAEAVLKPADNVPEMMVGTDFFAVSSSKVSVTLLSTDWTMRNEE